MHGFLKDVSAPKHRLIKELDIYSVYLSCITYIAPMLRLQGNHSGTARVKAELCSLAHTPLMQ